MNPSWLPNILSLDGPWEITLKKLYAIFEQDFICTKRYLDAREVWWDDRKLDGPYDEGFWHIISVVDKDTLERIPDFDRAKRLPWCGPTISNSRDKEVKCWDYREANGKIRTYVWLEHWEYVIILEKQTRRIGEIVFLISAYFVGGPSTRKKLYQKYVGRVT